MDIGCGPYKRLLDNFHQSESPYTVNVKFSKTVQNSAMSNNNSTKMLYIILTLFSRPKNNPVNVDVGYFWTPNSMQYTENLIPRETGIP